MWSIKTVTYNSFEQGCVDNTDSTATLVKDLNDSDKTLIITTIQKMANAVKNKEYENIIPLLQKSRAVNSALKIMKRRFLH